MSQCVLCVSWIQEYGWEGTYRSKANTGAATSIDPTPAGVTTHKIWKPELCFTYCLWLKGCESPLQVVQILWDSFRQCGCFLLFVCFFYKVWLLSASSRPFEWSDHDSAIFIFLILVGNEDPSKFGWTVSRTPPWKHLVLKTVVVLFCFTCYVCLNMFLLEETAM